MMRKAFAAVVLTCGVLAAASPSPALAGGGPVDYAGCVITVDPSTFSEDTPVEVSGSGLAPNFSTPILFDGEEIGTAETDAAGSFGPTVVTIPADASPGTHSISAACDANGNVSDTDFTVGGVSIARVTLEVDSVACHVFFDATLQGAEPGSTVSFARFSVRTPLGDVVADEDGNATLSLEFPAGTPAGGHTVQATGTDSNGQPFTASAPVQVSGADCDNGSGPLPRTGTDSTKPLVAYGAGAVFLGAAIVLVTRRRRNASESQ